MTPIHTLGLFEGLIGWIPKAKWLEVSEKIIEFIKGVEGFSATRYMFLTTLKDGTYKAGKWTIGWGTELTDEQVASRNYNRIDEKKATVLLRKAVKKYMGSSL